MGPRRYFTSRLPRPGNRSPSVVRPWPRTPAVSWERLRGDTIRWRVTLRNGRLERQTARRLPIEDRGMPACRLRKRLMVLPLTVMSARMAARMSMSYIP